MSKKIHQSFLEIADSLSPTLAQAIAAVGPQQLKRRSNTDLAETLCRAVAGQQLSTKAAATIWGRVLARAGRVRLIDSIATASPEELRACGLSGSKSKAMHAIAAATASGLLDEAKLDRLDHAERSRQLTSIWGVGQWTSDMIGIFYFTDKDVWPDGDVTVRKTLQRLTGRRRSTLRTSARFAPHRSYLAMYLYKIADSEIKPPTQGLKTSV